MELSKASLAQTVQRFWTRKRLLKLFTFALLLANVSMYCVGILAERQVLSSAIGLHEKIYVAYMQAVEAAKTADRSGVDGASPYWQALAQVRKQFPFHKMNIVSAAADNGIEAEHSRKALDRLHNKPRGWGYSEERDGWARSYYVLPTDDTSAFQAVTYIKDELIAWQSTSVLIGAYAFALLMAFGWFWTRALDSAATLAERHSKASSRGEAEGLIDEAKLAEMEKALAEIDVVIRSVQKNYAQIEDIVSQIRLLAVNGSIEAARSAESYRVFHVLMQEINQLALQAKEVINLSEDAPSSTARVANKR